MRHSNKHDRFFFLFCGALMWALSVSVISCGEENQIPLAPPTVDIQAGTYETYRDVTLSVGDGLSLLYTLDGSSPLLDTAVRYRAEETAVIRVDSTMTISAVTTNGVQFSDVASFTYDITGYKFFVAGHVYGRHGVYSTQEGLHTEFKHNAGGFPAIRSDTAIKMVFFVEDSLDAVTESECDELQTDIVSLGIPVYLAPGNHDYSDIELFTKRFGKDGTTWQSFDRERQRYIILDGNAAPWNIDGEQRAWLESQLSEGIDSIDTILVFVGKVLWVSNGHYDDMVINWREWGSSDINFWPEIMPLLQATGKDVHVFAGDACAFDGLMFMHDMVGNVSLYATGMGGGENEDHYLVVEVSPSGTISYSILPLWPADTPESIRKWQKTPSLAD
jgi:hypothetical protein